MTFVYYNPNATQVRLAGDLTLLDLNTGNTRYQPEEWQTGRYHVGGTEFLRDMTRDADGYWSVSIPMHAGGLSYWYRVWDPTQDWENKRIWDPIDTHPRPDGDTTFRVRNNDVLDAVYVPYDEKQNDPVLESRATYELPLADPAQRGTVQYIPYTTILGDSGYYLGVYLPPGYDANREKPYKVVYLGHGIFGDETDFMIPGNVPNILDNMIAKGEIEPTVAVTMGNHFTGTSLGFGSYNRTNAANNLVQTILPFIEANYNVSNKPEGRVWWVLVWREYRRYRDQQLPNHLRILRLFLRKSQFDDGKLRQYCSLGRPKCPVRFSGEGLLRRKPQRRQCHTGQF